MSNKTPIIFSIILLAVIIFCLVIFLVLYLCGVKIEMIGIGTRDSRVIYDSNFKSDVIKKIDIKQDTGNVILKQTTEDKIQVIAYGEKEEDIEVDLSSDTLTIDYTVQKRFTLFQFGRRKKDIIVYIPSSYYHEIKLKNDLGNCEIGNLENVVLDVECDAGNIEAEKVKNAKIKCDIVVNAGNVQITKLLIQEDSYIKADLGDVNIREINDVYIESRVDLGKATINGSNRDSNVTLKIECDCGNIKVGQK